MRTRTSKDELGDRMKMYERIETDRRLLPLAPIYARIDGRAFSRFTRGMDKPYDAELGAIMQFVTSELVTRTHAVVGYTQSDEINLAWMPRHDKDSSQFFNGRVEKMSSILGSLATSLFCQKMSETSLASYLPRYPHFDARVLSLPNTSELANMLLWRAQDGSRNAIQGVAQSLYSQKILQGKNQITQKSMIQDKGVDLDEWPEKFLYGILMVPRVVVRQGRVRRETLDLELLTPFSWDSLNGAVRVGVESYRGTREPPV